MTIRSAIFRNAILAGTILAGIAASGDVVDTYKFAMRIKVPRIYNNTESLGYRKYQNQSVVGEMLVRYTDGERPQITITNLVNRTHKINGKSIAYSCTVDPDMVFPRVNLIGSNYTGIFKTPSVSFFLDAEPDYSKGEDDEDNSLLLTLSGSGNSRKVDGGYIIRRFTGAASGTLGCGCKAYGHVSPTRVAGPCGATDEVDDVAAAFGKWTATFKSRSWCK